MLAWYLRLFVFVPLTVLYGCDRSESIHKTTPGMPALLPTIKVVAETVAKEAVFEGVVAVK